MSTFSDHNNLGRVIKDLHETKVIGKLFYQGFRIGKYNFTDQILSAEYSDLFCYQRMNGINLEKKFWMFYNHFLS